MSAKIEAGYHEIQAAFAKAETPEEELDATSKALALAAENYEEVRRTGSDGSGAAPDDAVRRALRALEDGARLWVMAELKMLAEARRYTRASKRYLQALDVILERSTEVAAADERAREHGA